MGNSQAEILGKAFFFFVFLILLANGCVEEFKEGYKEGLGEDTAQEEETAISELPEEQAAEDSELKEYIDMQNGYSIKAPEGWNIKIEGNKYLVASSPEGSLGIIIWPAVLEGKYKEMTIRDFANYLVGLILKQYPDFKRERMYEGPRKDSMEVIGTFTYDGVLKKISLFAYLENGYGMVSGYEAPADIFKEKEPMLRKILSSYQNIQSTIEKETAPTGLPLSEWSDGTISVNVPEGWSTSSGGQCSTKYFISKDPNDPISQVFYFSELGPVYLNAEKKAFDQQYVAMGGYQLFWTDAPVIQPLTPESFLKEGIKGVAAMALAKQLAPDLPVIENVNIVAGQDTSFPLGYNGLQKVFTAEFEENGKKGKGQFLVVTTEFPVMSLGYAMMLIGVTSSPEKFDGIRESLIKSIGSFTIDQDYVNKCIAAQNQAAAGALKAGKALSETSDIIMSAYEYRQQSMDRINEQWSDVILGRERLYDPGTETVYSVPNGFKDYYDTKRDSFEMNNLQEIPQEKWNEIPLDGEGGIR